MNPNQRFSILTFPSSLTAADSGSTSSCCREIRIRSPTRSRTRPRSRMRRRSPMRSCLHSQHLRQPGGFPNNHAPIQGLRVAGSAAGQRTRAVRGAGGEFQIVNVDTTNRNVDLAAIPLERKPPAARPREQTVKKYLPESYREAFNFTSPRTRTCHRRQLPLRHQGRQARARFSSGAGDFVSWGQGLRVSDAPAVSGGAGWPDLPHES